MFLTHLSFLKILLAVYCHTISWHDASLLPSLWPAACPTIILATKFWSCSAFTQKLHWALNAQNGRWHGLHFWALTVAIFLYSVTKNRTASNYPSWKPTEKIIKQLVNNAPPHCVNGRIRTAAQLCANAPGLCAPVSLWNLSSVIYLIILRCLLHRKITI